jgi:thiosulfate dehydrogenase
MDQSLYYPAMWLVIGALTIGLLFVRNGVVFYRKQLENDQRLPASSQRYLQLLGAGERMLWIFIVVFIGAGLAAMYFDQENRASRMRQKRAALWPVFTKDKVWQAPDVYLAETSDHARLIAYGRDLIAHTQDYFGENGLVKAGAINHMNCQNCHLDAGTKPFGNNYFAVSSTYPQMRARSGALETIPKRVNDCFQRSMNGAPLDTTSREMRAIVAYLHWLGTGIPKGEKPKGAGLVEPAFLNRAADPAKGHTVYVAKCASCHGDRGQGLPIPESARTYPPLWGDDSYNEGAGLFRLSRFAGYVKANMPFGATYDNPQLTDEEAWDVAAFVNAQPRPKHPFLDTDWPKTDKKPFDHPFGPFADTFPETQHKFGPFEPIIAYHKSNQKKQ